MVAPVEVISDSGSKRYALIRSARNLLPGDEVLGPHGAAPFIVESIVARTEDPWEGKTIVRTADGADHSLRNGELFSIYRDILEDEPTTEEGNLLAGFPKPRRSTGPL